MTEGERYIAGLLASVNVSLNEIKNELKKFNSSNKKLTEQRIKESRSNVLKNKKLLAESK